MYSMKVVMAEQMEISQTQTVNLLEFVENAYSEEVNIDMEGVTSKKFSCNMCDFKNHDKGGMSRHVKAKHRLGGMKRPGNDESIEDSRKKLI